MGAWVGDFQLVLILLSACCGGIVLQNLKEKEQNSFAEFFA
jgi:hypothetical protein